MPRHNTESQIGLFRSDQSTRPVRRVPPACAVKVAGPVAVTAVILSWRLLFNRPEALDRCARLDQHPVHREVLPRQKPPHRRKPNQPCQKARRHFASRKTLPVLGEHRRVPRPPVDAETHEPGEQKVELQLLHQVALRADQIESLQKKCPQQLLRRDPGTPRVCVQNLEILRHLRQRLDSPKLMVLRNTRLQIHVAEQVAAALALAPHDPHARSRTSRQRITPIPSAPRVFQQPASLIRKQLHSY